MIAYTQDELISATQAVRNFSKTLEMVKSKEKVVIVKNNNFEAVMIDPKKYEKMVEAVDILEKIYTRTKTK